MVNFNRRGGGEQADIACTEKSLFYSDIVISRCDIKNDILMLFTKGIEVVIMVSFLVEQIAGHDESVYTFAAEIGNDVAKGIVSFRSLLFRF